MPPPAPTEMANCDSYICSLLFILFFCYMMRVELIYNSCNFFVQTLYLQILPTIHEQPNHLIFAVFLWADSKVQLSSKCWTTGLMRRRMVTLSGNLFVSFVAKDWQSDQANNHVLPFSSIWSKQCRSGGGRRVNERAADEKGDAPALRH